MKRLSLAVALLLAALAAPPRLQAVAAVSPGILSAIDGLWDATVVTTPTGGAAGAPGAEVPFRFEIGTSGTEAQGFFFEGDRKVGSSSGTFTDGVLKLEYDFLNTTLEVTLTGDELIGTYRNNRPDARPQPVRMHRFTPTAGAEESTPALAGNWEMRRNADEVTAPRDTRTWHVYLRQAGAEVSGTILRIDGDTGTLVGHWANGQLVLSHFAGERPNLFVATPNADGTLAVTLNGNAHYLVVRSGEARAKGIPEPPDPSRYTNVKDPLAPFHFAFPDLNGNLVSDSDPSFRGKVILLSIGGSWCPNCHDEAPFLSELYRDYRARGLEIVGLMFENDADPKVARPRVRTFVKRYAAQYPMLIAGTTQPSPASKTIAEALPQLVNFGAYPTTIVLGRDARVRSVHAGFASPATGEEHVRLKQEVRELIEKLLAEPAP
jgi:thiol-disulfide isomerase/thioredoxin